MRTIRFGALAVTFSRLPLPPTGVSTSDTVPSELTWTTCIFPSTKTCASMRSGATRSDMIWLEGSFSSAAVSAAGRSSEPLSTPVGGLRGHGGTTPVASRIALWKSSSAPLPACSAVVAPPMASAMIPIRTSGTMIPRAPAGAAAAGPSPAAASTPAAEPPADIAAAAWGWAWTSAPP